MITDFLPVSCHIALDTVNAQLILNIKLLFLWPKLNFVIG